MTVTGPPNSEDAPSATLSLRSALRVGLPSLLLSAFATIACYVALGPTTGFFFGAVVVATLLTPPLVLSETLPARQLLVAWSVAHGVAAACLFAIPDPAVTFGDWLRGYLVLIAYVAALSGLGALLVRLRVAPLFASALVVVVALAWLAWPVWLSPWVAGRPRLVGALTACHPLLALDGVLRHLGTPWSERPLMYNNLSILNQDVAYELPRTVWQAVALHAGIGAACLFLAYRGPARRAPDRVAGDPPAAAGGPS
jgi:hypothetical protein